MSVTVGTEASAGPISTAASGALEVVAVQVDAWRSTVELRGELDVSNTDLVAGVLRNQLALGHRFVRLDLSRLTFLDCAGLRGIVHAHNEFLAARGTLVLTCPSPRVTRLLKISRLDEALLIGASSDGHERHLKVVPPTPRPGAALPTTIGEPA